jgi:hypothetical protein
MLVSMPVPVPVPVPVPFMPAPVSVLIPPFVVVFKVAESDVLVELPPPLSEQLYRHNANAE